MILMMMMMTIKIQGVNLALEYFFVATIFFLFGSLKIQTENKNNSCFAS
jgi:hypothetical protein